LRPILNQPSLPLSNLLVRHFPDRRPHILQEILDPPLHKFRVLPRLHYDAQTNVPGIIPIGDGDNVPELFLCPESTERGFAEDVDQEVSSYSRTGDGNVAQVKEVANAAVYLFWVLVLNFPDVIAALRV
jgi:hypothetical protein